MLSSLRSPRLIAAMLAGIVMASAGEAAASPSLTVARDGSATRFAITGLGLASSTPSADGSEIALRFSGPVPAALVESMQRDSGGTIVAITYGYDSALLRFAGPSDVTFRESAGGFGFTVTPRGSDDAARRLAIQQGRLAEQQGDYAAARAAYQSAGAETDPEAARALADSYASQGDWPNAERAYARALALSPGDTSLKRALAEARRENAGTASLGVYGLRSGDEEREGVYADVRVPLGLRVSLTGDVEAVAYEGPAIDSTGTVVATDGRKLKGSVGLAYTLPGGEVRVAATGAERIGVRTDTDVRFLGGTLTVGAAWREPDWAYLEGLLSDGHRSGARLGYVREAGPFRIDTGAAWNSYGLGSADRLAESWSARARASYGFEIAPRTWLTAAYSFDGEWFGRRAEILTGGGPVRIIPSDNREVHAADLNLFWQFHPSASLDLTAGYARDMLGEDGPYGSASFTWDAADAWSVSADVFYWGVGTRGDNTSEPTTQGGLRLTHRFATGARDEPRR